MNDGVVIFGEETLDMGQTILMSELSRADEHGAFEMVANFILATDAVGEDYVQRLRDALAKKTNEGVPVLLDKARATVPFDKRLSAVLHFDAKRRIELNKQQVREHNSGLPDFLRQFGVPVIFASDPSEDRQREKALKEAEASMKKAFMRVDREGLQRILEEGFFYSHVFVAFVANGISLDTIKQTSKWYKDLQADAGERVAHEWVHYLKAIARYDDLPVLEWLAQKQTMAIPPLWDFFDQAGKLDLVSLIHQEAQQFD